MDTSTAMTMDTDDFSRQKKDRGKKDLGKKDGDHTIFFT